MSNETVFLKKDTTANPAPLGLIGFGLTTILLNLHNAGLYPLDLMIVAMGIFCGGIMQIFAGAFEFKKGNTFGTAAFLGYGSFWLSLVAIWLMGKMNLDMPVSETSMGCYLGIWGVLSVFFFISTLKGKMIGKLVFGTVTLLFFLLSIANFTGNHLIHTLAGIDGIICGSLALYEGCALIVNGTYGKEVLPL